MLSYVKLPKIFWVSSAYGNKHHQSLSSVHIGDGYFIARVDEKGCLLQACEGFGCRAFAYIPKVERSKLYGMT